MHKASSFFLNYEYINNEGNQILPLNYMMYCCKVFDDKQMISIYRNYLYNVAPDNNYSSIYLFYVNASLLLIDMLLSISHTEDANLLITKLSLFIRKCQYANTHSSIENSRSRDNDVNTYINTIELFTEEVNWYEVIYLYTAYYHLSSGNYTQANDNLKDFKKEYFASSHKKNCYPLYKTLRTFYNVMKVKLHFHNNNILKSLNHINSIYESNTSKNVMTILFYYNSIGIISLKQRKYNYAKYYFKLCEKIINTNVNSCYHYLLYIRFNTALCSFFTKQYKKCYQILVELKSIDMINYNPYLYYRLGLCCIELYFQEIRSNSNSAFKYMKERNIFVLNNIFTNDSIEEDANDNLVEAIQCFKQCLLLLEHKTPIRKYAESLHVLFNDSNSNTNSNSNELFDTNYNDFKCRPQYKQLYLSAYSNLLFSLLRNKNYNEVIYFATQYKNIEDNNNYNNDILNHYIIYNYLVAAYVKMSNIEKAIEVIQDNNINCEDSFGAFIQLGNLYPEVNYKLALYVNLLQMNIMNNNREEVERNVTIILSLIKYPIQKGIPPFIINILVHYYIYVGKHKEAFTLLKNHKLNISN